MTTRELIEAVNSSPEKWDSALGFENLVGIEDYNALRAACAAVLDDLIACRYENGAGWRISAGENGPMALNKVLPIARALRERVR